jgi:lambda repressor-like predicted transcriptional regulator
MQIRGQRRHTLRTRNGEVRNRPNCRTREIVLTLTPADVITTLRFERAMKGLGINEQARRIGVSPSTLNRVLRGKLRPGRAICRHLALEPSEANYLSRVGN